MISYSETTENGVNHLEQSIKKAEDIIASLYGKNG